MANDVLFFSTTPRDLLASHSPLSPVPAASVMRIHSRTQNGKLLRKYFYYALSSLNSYSSEIIIYTSEMYCCILWFFIYGARLLPQFLYSDHVPASFVYECFFFRLFNYIIILLLILHSKLDKLENSFKLILLGAYAMANRGRERERERKRGKGKSHHYFFCLLAVKLIGIGPKSTYLFAIFHNE